MLSKYVKISNKNLIYYTFNANLSIFFKSPTSYEWELRSILKFQNKLSTVIYFYVS